MPWPLNGIYAIQPTLGGDELALVCPNCGAHNLRAPDWVAAHADDTMPCALCGNQARLPTPTLESR